MEIDALRIIYMGTPEFAVVPLARLMDAGANVVSVITAPDRPAGRGKKIRYSPVKEFALSNGLPLLQPANLKDPAFVARLHALDPHLQVVVAFRMLPEVVWRVPLLGTFNLHASLLPDYRGAAPINHVLINGETHTGVTTFLIDEKIDTGQVLLQEETSIGDRETAGELHDRLMEMGAGLVLQTVEKLADGDIEPVSQESLAAPGKQLHEAPKLTREDGRIKWDRHGKELFNLVRGLSPYPGAFTTLTRKDNTPVLCKIYSASFEKASHRHETATMISDGKSSLKVAVRDGYLHVHSIQQEGKRRMGIREFLAGINLTSCQPRFS